MQGVADREVARRLGADKSAVNRHRRFHLERPNLDRASIIEKDREAREERRMLAQAAQLDAPSPSAVIEAMLGLQAQAKKLDSIEQRLERMATMSEQEKSASSVAQLASQQLRSVEVGSRLAGTGGYAQPRTVGPGGSEGSKFSITIMLGNGKDVSINATPVPQSAVVEGEISEESEGRE
jgi:hypothetical protein